MVEPSNHAQNNHSFSSEWKGLFITGGVAALVVVVITLVEIVFFMVYPQPVTVSDWFQQFQNNKLIGLIDFWGLEILMYVMFILVFLALNVSLRNTNQSLMAIASVFALIGIGVFFATNNPVSMLNLSDQYARATTAEERSIFLAAGEALLANTSQRGVAGFNIALFLVSIAGLLSSIVMLQSNVFTKSTAIMGVLAFGLSLTDYLRQAVTKSLEIALIVIMLGALFLVIWFILVGLRLIRLGNSMI